MTIIKKAPSRCVWVRTPLDAAYHDAEWGVPLHADGALFELLILEGAQAGLSWSTILKKREHYRRVFDGFDVLQVAAYDEAKLAELMAAPGIVRNRLKLAAAVSNARRFINVQTEFGSFDRYLWRFVQGRPLINAWQHARDVPVKTPVSDRLSKDLRKRGFKFVGSTICYAFMQAAGLVNDHTMDCFRHQACTEFALKSEV